MSRKLVVRIVIVVACLILACVAVVACLLAPKFLNMKSEYVTAGVIRDTREYVERTRGQWPKSWQDLGTGDFSSYTKMRFDLDPATATEQDVLTAISPRSGKYYTYPHAEDDLRRLYAEMLKHRPADK